MRTLGMGQLGGLSPQGKIAVGVIVGLISASLQAIGLTLQRKSHILEDNKYPYDIYRPPYKRRRWQMGMLMFVISNIVGSTIQITTLPLPVLSTLQASGLVFNTIFATLILGEPFTRYSLIGTILVTIGAVLIATFGAIGEPAHTLNQLLVLLQRHNFVVWVICTGVLVVLVLAGARFLRLLLPSSRTKRQGILNLHAPRLLRFQGRIRLLRGMSYGFVSGILSAHSLLLAKSAVELLVRTIVDRVNQFNRWQSWVILIAMIFLALIQLFYLHRGLKLCSTSVLYPFVFCIYNITAILDGLIYFHQASQLAGYHAGLIALGTIVLLSGVLCLSWRLEDVEAHYGISVAGPPQSALGPGMGMVEGSTHPPEDLSLDGEESGEHQPLLQKTYARRGSFRPRAPSLPLFSPLPRRTSALDLDPGSIWAELDDADYDYTGRNPPSPLSHLQSSPSRPRSKTGTYGTYGVFKRNTLNGDNPRGLRHSVGPMMFRTWDARRTPSSIQEESRLRRTSTSAAESHPTSQKRRIWTAFHHRDGTTPWNPSEHPIPADHDSPDNKPPDHPPPSPSATTPLAGPRRLLITAWRNSVRYLSGRTDTRSERPSVDPENQSDNSEHIQDTQPPNDTSGHV